MLLYQVGNFAEARKNYEAAVAHGGYATFHVYHDHGIGNFGNNCRGYLYVSRGRVKYVASGSMHSFDVPRAQVKEAKKNRSAFSIGLRRGDSFPLQVAEG